MLNVLLLTPQKEVLCSPSSEIIIPTTCGEIGVLKHHINFFASITSGVLKLKNKQKTDFFAIHHGFVRISKDTVSIIVKLCEVSQELDKTRLEAAWQKSIDNLKHKDDIKWHNKLKRSLTRKELLRNF